MYGKKVLKKVHFCDYSKPALCFEMGNYRPVVSYEDPLEALSLTVIICLCIPVLLSSVFSLLWHIEYLSYLRVIRLLGFFHAFEVVLQLILWNRMKSASVGRLQPPSQMYTMKIENSSFRKSSYNTNLLSKLNAVNFILTDTNPLFFSHSWSRFLNRLIPIFTPISFGGFRGLNHSALVVVSSRKIS